MAPLLPFVSLAVALQEQTRPESPSYGPGGVLLLFLILRALFNRSNSAAGPADLSLEIEALIREGHYSDAEKKLAKLIRATEREQGTDGIGVAVYVRRLAQMKAELKQLNEAETLFQRVLDIQEKNLGTASPDLMPTLSSLASIAAAKNDVEGFFSTQRRVLSIHSQVHGDDHQGSAPVWNQMGVMAADHEDFEAAEEYFRRASNIAEKAEKPTATASIFVTNLGNTLMRRGQLQEAESCFRRSLQAAEATCRKDDPWLASVLADLADVEMRLQKPEAAEANLRRALQILSNVPPELRGSTAQLEAAVLEFLCNALEELRQREESIEVNRRWLEVLEANLKPDDPAIAVAVGMLGCQLMNLGKLDDAEPELRRALAISEKSTEPRAAEYFPSAAVNLGMLLRLKGNLGEAEKIFWRSIEAADKRYGRENLTTSVALSKVAEMRLAQGNFESAEAFFREALAIREKLLRPNDELIAHALGGLAVATGKRGAYEEEESLLRRALLIFQAVGDQDEWVLRVTQELADCLFERKLFDEAEIECRRALNMSTRLFGETHVRTATIMTALARVLTRNGNRSEARTHLTRAYTVFTKLLGPEHIASTSTKERLDDLSLKAAATKAN